jgi:hypothetical protein
MNTAWSKTFRAIERLGFTQEIARHRKFRDSTGRIVAVTSVSPSDNAFGLRKFMADFKRTTGIDLRKAVGRS